MSPLPLQVATALVVTWIAAREAIHLARHPRDLPLRLMAPGLICLAFAASIGIPEIRQPLDDALGGVFTIAVNLCLMMMAYCYAGFFVVDNKDIPEFKRRVTVRRELIPLGLVSAFILIIWWISPPDIRAHPVSVTTSARWQTSAFIGAVEIYGMTYWVLGIRRALSYRQGVEERSLKTAIPIVVIGAAGMVGEYFTGMITLVLYWFVPATSHVFTVLRAANLTVLLGGQAMLAVGLAYPTLADIAGGAVAHYDRAIQRRSAPWTEFLWRVLTDRFPYIQLPDSEVHPGRKIGEITDGLARLSPYLDPATPSTGVKSARVAASSVTAALNRVDAERRARWAGALEWECGDGPYPRIEPDFRSWRARMRWMAALGRALARHGITDPGQDLAETGA